jgi:hypothetical protein
VSAATIGAVTVDILRGEPQSLKTRTMTWQTPGVNGYGAMTTGMGDSEFKFRTISYINAGSDPGGAAFCAAAIALQGASPISIVDNFGTSWPQVLIEHIEVVNRKAIIQAAGPATRVELEWSAVST